MEAIASCLSLRDGVRQGVIKLGLDSAANVLKKVKRRVGEDAVKKHINMDRKKAKPITCDGSVKRADPRAAVNTHTGPIKCSAFAACLEVPLPERWSRHARLMEAVTDA